MERTTQALLIAMSTFTATVGARAVAATDDVEDLERQLAAVTMERDALLDEEEAAATRHDTCQATTDEMRRTVHPAWDLAVRARRRWAP